MKAALNEHLRERREAVGMGELHLLLCWNPPPRFIWVSELFSCFGQCGANGPGSTGAFARDWKEGAWAWGSDYRLS